MKSGARDSAEPVRVWFIAHQKALTYGANLSLVNLLDGLAALPIAPRVLLPEDGSLNEALRQRNIPALVHPFYWWFSRFRTFKIAAWRVWKNLKAVRSLAPQLAADGAELIYTNTSVVPLGVPLALRLRIPHIWHLREYGDLDHGLIPDWPAMIRRFFIHRASATISNSRSVREFHFSRPRPRRAHVVYNGVLWDRQFAELEERRRQRPDNSGPFTFVLVGRLVPSKGQDLAIQAMAELRRHGTDCRLRLVGDGDPPFVAHCRKLVADLAVADRVEFRDYNSNPFDEFFDADAALMCSRMEAMGRVTVEAMAAGLPVIGRASGGTPELVQHQTNGLLFDGDAQSLATEMRRVVERPELAIEMGRNAARIARQLYSIEAYAAGVGRVIESTLRRTFPKAQDRVATAVPGT